MRVGEEGTYACACTSQYPIRMVDHDDSPISAGGHDHRMIIRCPNILPPSAPLAQIDKEVEKKNQPR